MSAGSCKFVGTARATTWGRPYAVIARRAIARRGNPFPQNQNKSGKTGLLTYLLPITYYFSFLPVSKKEPTHFRESALCWHYLFSRLGHGSSRREETCRWHVLAAMEEFESIRKATCISASRLCWHYLFSRPVTRQVSSAKVCLTSVFGMGTGGPTPQSIPTSSGHTLKTEHEFSNAT